jgi:hypothetical protein
MPQMDARKRGRTVPPVVRRNTAAVGGTAVGGMAAEGTAAADTPVVDTWIHHSEVCTQRNTRIMVILITSSPA